MPRATATASKAGPTFADDAGTRTTQPVSTRSSLARVGIATRCDDAAGTFESAQAAESGGDVRRQCAWFGCSAVAIATFTFDSSTRTVLLDTPLDGSARAGELCHRHARSLSPPRGWRVG